MNNDNKNIVRDIKDLLSEYLTESFAKDFIKVLDGSIALEQVSQTSISALEKSQIEYKIPEGINYRSIIDKVITVCSKLLTEDKYFNLMLDLSQLMFFSGEISYALEIAEDLVSKLQSNKKLANIQAEANLMISKIYWAQAYWDECSHFIIVAKRIFKSIGSDSGLAKCENMLGTLYGEKGEFEKAQKHLENALEYLNRKDDTSARAMILTNLGIINTIKENYESAIWNYKNSSELFAKLQDSRRLSRVYHNIGMLYLKMEKYDVAMDEFNKCLSLSLEKNYLSNCAVSYIGKAFVYTKLDNPALADAYTEKAMEIAYKLNDTLSIADIYKIKGMIQRNLENFDLSEEMFENSIRLNKDMESKLNEAESCAQLGDLLKTNNKFAEAKPYVETAASFFNQLKFERKAAGLVEQSM